MTMNVHTHVASLYEISPQRFINPVNLLGSVPSNLSEPIARQINYSVMPSATSGRSDTRNLKPSPCAFSCNTARAWYICETLGRFNLTQRWNGQLRPTGWCQGLIRDRSIIMYIRLQHVRYAKKFAIKKNLLLNTTPHFSFNFVNSRYLWL